MVSQDHHAVRAFDEDLHHIRALVAEIGGLTEVAIQGSLTALIQGDNEAAAKIVADEIKIHRLAEEIERHCIRLIALRAPMADDLREILAAFKISVLLERMGACARNVAEQVPKTQGFPKARQVQLLKMILRDVAEMVRSALDAFIQRDPAACPSICASDAAVDYLHGELFRELTDAMAESPANIGAGTCILLASVKLERIGDHAANIARIVHYSITGEALPRRRQASLAAA